MSRARLRDERGFSLLELQVAELIGGFVITAALMMLIVAVNSTNRVTDRVNAAQVGRTTMEQIQQRIHSQTCLFPGEYKVNGSAAATGSQASIVHADGEQFVFLGDLGAASGSTAVTGNVGFRPQLRYLYLVTDATGRRGRLLDGWIDSAGIKPPYDFSLPGTASLTAFEAVAKVRQHQPTRVRAMADGVTNIVSETAPVGATGPTVPIFRYYDAAGSEIAVNTSIGGIPATQLGTINRVTVGFKILGASGKDQSGSGATATDKRTAAFRNEIYLRTIADRCE